MCRCADSLMCWGVEATWFDGVVAGGEVISVSAMLPCGLVCCCVDLLMCWGVVADGVVARWRKGCPTRSTA